LNERTLTNGTRYFVGWSGLERETPMSKLDGKVAIVTGAARGLGRAYARRVAGLGAKVAVIPGSTQSNRDRAELVALRRLETVEDCAKVVEFLATDLSDYVMGAVIPIDGGLVRG
jgi:NAD(P)-dependent dehydrogenase (short-subunit alcohol dehydrogenase family)